MVLAPGQFLVGVTRSASRPSNKLSVTERWRNCQRLDEQFCKQWSPDYLSCLQRRQKWLEKRKNLQAGVIVLVKDERLPFNIRVLGRITETHFGQDGLVQVVTVKSQGGVIKRPVAKWCPLPKKQF